MAGAALAFTTGATGAELFATGFVAKATAGAGSFSGAGVEVKKPNSPPPGEVVVFVVAGATVFVGTTEANGTGVFTTGFVATAAAGAGSFFSGAGSLGENMSKNPPVEPATGAVLVTAAAMGASLIFAASFRASAIVRSLVLGCGVSSSLSDAMDFGLWANARATAGGAVGEDFTLDCAANITFGSLLRKLNILSNADSPDFLFACTGTGFGDGIGMLTLTAGGLGTSTLAIGGSTFLSCFPSAALSDYERIVLSFKF